MDKDDKEIAFYSPGNEAKTGPIFTLADNEDLIGIYGVCSNEGYYGNYFSSFGFIVKVTQK